MKHMPFGRGSISDEVGSSSVAPAAVEEAEDTNSSEAESDDGDSE